MARKRGKKRAARRPNRGCKPRREVGPPSESSGGGQRRVGDGELRTCPGSLQSPILRYDPYGAVTISIGGTPQGSDPLGQPWMYTGRFTDEETGLYYYRARYYSSKTGRFLQRDPLGYAPGSNVYEYVQSGPATRRDPLGLDWESTSREYEEAAAAEETARAEHDAARAAAEAPPPPASLFAGTAGGIGPSAYDKYKEKLDALTEARRVMSAAAGPAREDWGSAPDADGGVPQPFPEEPEPLPEPLPEPAPEPEPESDAGGGFCPLIPLQRRLFEMFLLLPKIGDGIAKSASEGFSPYKSGK